MDCVNLKRNYRRLALVLACWLTALTGLKSQETNYSLADKLTAHFDTAVIVPVELPNLGRIVRFQYVPPARKWWVAGGHAAVWAGTYIALNKAWYEGYDRMGFHTFNDLPEWNQMDKLGHIWSTYQLGRVSGELWTWAGLNRNTAVWLGGASAMAFQSIIELQDAYSVEWGFSWSDMAANALGAGAYVSQELLWQEQRLQIKMGYYPYSYAPEIRGRARELYGTGFAERILKDYNAQTYWLSANMHRFFPDSKFPKWLNLATGYSSDLMLGGRENKWTTDLGVEVDRRDIHRTRRYYISVDIDLTQIPTRKKWVKTLFAALNAVKVPAPALEYNNRRQLQWHWLHQ